MLVDLVHVDFNMASFYSQSVRRVHPLPVGEGHDLAPSPAGFLAAYGVTSMQGDSATFSGSKAGGGGVWR